MIDIQYNDKRRIPVGGSSYEGNAINDGNSPGNAVIAKEKLTQYLLIKLPKDDKSKLLAQLGYTLKNWEQLEQDLRSQVLTQPAQLIETTIYGEKYAIHSYLQGRNGKP